MSATLPRLEEGKSLLGASGDASETGGGQASDESDALLAKKRRLQADLAEVERLMRGGGGGDARHND